MRPVLAAIQDQIVAANILAAGARASFPLYCLRKRGADEITSLRYALTFVWRRPLHWRRLSVSRCSSLVVSPSPFVAVVSCLVLLFHRDSLSVRSGIPSSWLVSIHTCEARRKCLAILFPELILPFSLYSICGRRLNKTRKLLVLPCERFASVGNNKSRSTTSLAFGPRLLLSRSRTSRHIATARLTPRTQALV